jgi:hypothetical protein
MGTVHVVQIAAFPSFVFSFLHAPDEERQKFLCALAGRPQMETRQHKSRCSCADCQIAICQLLCLSRTEIADGRIRLSGTL